MHWYNQDGNPVYQVKRADGNGMRDTTLRDARKLILQPSVTEILKVPDKPALTRYFVEQAYMAMATLPEKEGESIDARISRAKADAREHSIKARDKGVDIHRVLENYFQDKSYQGYEKMCLSVDRALESHCGSQKWISEQSFSHKDGYGGKVDLHNDNYIVDFKTKDFDDPEQKLWWPEMAMQLSAYRRGLKKKKAKLINVFISTKIDLVVLHEWKEDDYYKGFKLLLDYWKWSKGYESGY